MNVNFIKRIFYSILFALLLISCNFTAPLIQHTPPLATVATHTNKGELITAGYYKTANDIRNFGTNDSSRKGYYQKVNGLQVQSSYAINNSVALSSSYMYSKETNGFVLPSGRDSGLFNYKRNLGELGISFYNPLSPNSKWYSSIGMGIGYGNNKTTENRNSTITPTNFYNHDIYKIYFQPSFYNVTQNGHLVLGVKVSMIQFKNVKTSYTAEQRSRKRLFALNSSSNLLADFYCEYIYYIKTLPWLGVQTQFLFSTDLSKKLSYNHNNINAGVGLCIRLRGKS
jgi:hypothetical protein